MKAEYQLQIDAIKGKRIFYEEYGELILVTDGRIGVYLKDKDYNHNPINSDNYWNVVHQGLNIINDFSSTSNLSKKEIASSVLSGEL